MVLTRYMLPVLAAAGAALAQCEGPINIQHQGDAEAIAECSIIEGDVLIGSSVSGTLAIDGVEEITGDLTCVNATQLTSLSANNLATIGGKFELEELQILSTLAFDSLTEVLTIQWIALPALQSLTFNRGVSTVTNILVSNTGLTSLNGLELETVGLMDINNNRYLDTVDVNNMRIVNTSISFAANSRTLEIKLPNLQQAANMTFRNVSDVQVPSLSYVNGSIGFYSNTFESISLPNLTETGQALVFQDNMGLSNISVPQIIQIGAALNINNNPDLLVIDGFPALETVVGALDFSGVFDEVNLPALSDARGGFNMQTTSSTFTCDGFDDLRDRDIVKGVYTCAGSQETPGGLGTNADSSGNNSRSAAPTTFNPDMPTYSVFGLIAFLFML
ncbi:hypothetical protein EPUS_08963 [Endocarpon pusillum Z07020]|uniref:Protein ecm33 n=1 Tax=Endocarpon pusillum (strain Z07020 / HMAS-L-300199) TaxID=1263415 RepID=U1GSD9_ENDPU|nr:uncharacterized protein EPUS_08963 [Endocarpon pusillum Z07020]ERF74911.1 hypothetical protein EPUS_08963 [Endocarpon pusillum Z07020]